MKQTETSAARWDKRYGDAAGRPFGELPSEYLRMILARSDFRAASALCLADGDGRNGTWLARQGLAVTAADVSAVATEQALAFDSAAGVSVERIVADLAAWAPPADRRWDAVFIFYLHGTAPLRQRALRVAVDALAPGGWLVLEGFSKDQAGRAGMGPDDADRLYGLDELREACAGLEIVEAFAGTLLLDEGERHGGEAAVVRFAARRPG